MDKGGHRQCTYGDFLRKKQLEPFLVLALLSKKTKTGAPKLLLEDTKPTFFLPRPELVKWEKHDKFMKGRPGFSKLEMHAKNALV